MIQLHDLSITHTKDLSVLVNHLTLTIKNGDKVAIIGEEGNGKSTLLQALYQKDLVQSYCLVEGKIINTFHSMGYLPQGLDKKDAELSLNDYFFNDFTTDINYALLYRYAKELHFDSERLTSAQVLDHLSGGEKIKLQLLKLLAQDKEVLFLDEPSNDLDIAMLEWLENFIQNSSQTIIYISHDERLLARTSQKIIHLERLKKRQEARTSVHKLDYNDYKNQREHQYHKDMKTAKKERSEHQKTLEKLHRQKQQVEHQLRNCKDSSVGRLLAKKMHGLLSNEKRYEKESRAFTDIPIQEEEMTIKFQPKNSPSQKVFLHLEGHPLLIDQTVLVKKINFTLKSGDKIAIIGENGIGKSTFLKELYYRLSQKTQYHISYMPQNYLDSLPLNKAPLEFFTTLFPNIERKHILSHLACLNFTREEVKHTIKRLSGGQKGKLLLLRLVLEEPDILILDEPSRNFSPLSQDSVRRLFKDFSGTIVTVSHDREFIKAVCQKGYKLNKKGIENVLSLD